MKIIKRNGTEMLFEPKKIYNAVTKANLAVEAKDRICDEQISAITDRVTNICASLSGTPSVEDVQEQCRHGQYFQ